MSSCSQKEIYQFTRRFYQLLRDHGDHIFYRKLRSRCGEYQPDTEDIIIDYRRELIPTLIHEALHHWHPNENETWILREESRIVNSLSLKQIKNIIKMMAAYIC